MYGFYALDEDGSDIEHNVGVNVSDYFIGYYRARDGDRSPARRVAGDGTSRLQPRADVGGGVEGIRDLSRRLLDSPDGPRGRGADHRTGGVMGALHLATSETDRNFTETICASPTPPPGVLALSIARIRRSAGEGRRALEEALAALELTGTAIVGERPEATAARAAQRGRAAPAGRHPRPLAISTFPSYSFVSPGRGRVSRRAPVLAANEASGAAPRQLAAGAGRRLVTVLELQREAPGLGRRLARIPDPREREVAVLVVEGLERSARSPTGSA